MGVRLLHRHSTAVLLELALRVLARGRGGGARLLPRLERRQLRRRGGGVGVGRREPRAGLLVGGGQLPQRGGAPRAHGEQRGGDALRQPRGRSLQGEEDRRRHAEEASEQAHR